ncbi:MAG: aminotransferase class V-fold PLP-dependent enzyme [Oligoflexales bacterium]|nr:aminotransferase class V-fold PLP-dependent enzyme [Oligoflexales bacterium]
MTNKIYFDNATTSWPKPKSMLRSMEIFEENIGVSPGRSSHSLSISSARVMHEARSSISELLGAENPCCVAFCMNATQALNMALSGLLKRGDHVIVSAMEHNSVMRPLRALEEKGVELDISKGENGGVPDDGNIASAIRPNTRAIVINHASNVTGAIAPVKKSGRLAREHNLVCCVDAAQSLGFLDIDVREMNIDMLAFTGHKFLMGPTGTGGLYIRKGLEHEVAPILVGGTGSNSEFETHPSFMPDKLEAGTPNILGISGLNDSVKYVRSIGLPNIREKLLKLREMFLGGLSGIENAVIYTSACDGSVPIVSFNIKGRDPSDVSHILDEKYGILSRPGLHCSPLAHKTIGTFPKGTVRFSFSYFNSTVEIKEALEALREISKNNDRD